MKPLQKFALLFAPDLRQVAKDVEAAHQALHSMATLGVRGENCTAVRTEDFYRAKDRLVDAHLALTGRAPNRG